MKIVLSGVETNNKGAELMLYAILQEIEKVYPKAEVYISPNMIRQGVKYVHTTINLKLFPTPSLIVRILRKCKITGILNRIGFYSVYLNNLCPIKNVDYFIDGSGLLFSDKRILSNQTAVLWHKLLSAYKKSGSKIIFLPQGFGPFNKKCSQNTIFALDNYADLIFAREKTSYKYLINVVKNKGKVKLFTDFTSLVEGHCPKEYKNLTDYVCIIPNIQMINKGVVTKEEYFAILSNLIDSCKICGRNVYLLNHEGIKDENLAKEYITTCNNNIELVTGLNAIEVKGLISTAYLVISSRFHGVASALNSGVPCLATSWHHKYEELFADFNQSDCVLKLYDNQLMTSKIKSFLTPSLNASIRETLKTVKPHIQQQNKEMWNIIWDL